MWVRSSSPLLVHALQQRLLCGLSRLFEGGRRVRDDDDDDARDATGRGRSAERQTGPGLRQQQHPQQQWRHKATLRGSLRDLACFGSAAGCARSRPCSPCSSLDSLQRPPICLTTSWATSITARSSARSPSETKAPLK